MIAKLKRYQLLGLLGHICELRWVRTSANFEEVPWLSLDLGVPKELITRNKNVSQRLSGLKVSKMTWEEARTKSPSLSIITDCREQDAVVEWALLRWFNKAFFCPQLWGREWDDEIENSNELPISVPLSLYLLPSLLYGILKATTCWSSRSLVFSRLSVGTGLALFLQTRYPSLPTPLVWQVLFFWFSF